MASAHPLLERLEGTIGRYRDTIAQLTPELAHLREKEEIVMQYMSEMGSALKTLISDRQASDARASAAEAQVATLKAQIAADEATLKGMLDATNDEIGNETPATPVTTTAPSGATVTVDPTAGTTTHVDPVAGTTTTVDHETGTATATDTSGAAVEPAPAAVTEATTAAAAAGVDVPAAS